MSRINVVCGVIINKNKINYSKGDKTNYGKGILVEKSKLVKRI